MNVPVSGRFGRGVIGGLLSGVLMLIPVMASGQSDEYDVKAVFLFNFTKFVEWPPASVSQAFVICVLGDDSFASRIEKLTEGKTTNGVPIQVRKINDVASAKQCQIVFLSSSGKNKAAELHDAVCGARILTVGETEDFVRRGGTIYLATEDNRVTVVVNLASAEDSGVKISARLLSLARIFKGERAGGSACSTSKR